MVSTMKRAFAIAAAVGAIALPAHAGPLSLVRKALKAPFAPIVVAGSAVMGEDPVKATKEYMSDDYVGSGVYVPPPQFSSPTAGHSPMTSYVVTGSMMFGSDGSLATFTSPNHAFYTTPQGRMGFCHATSSGMAFCN
jgi:hypothetical protein